MNIQIFLELYKKSTLIHRNLQKEFFLMSLRLENKINLFIKI